MRHTTRWLRLGVALALVCSARAAGAQSAPAGLPFQTLTLEDLSAFRAPAPGWRIAGEVTVDRHRALHLAAGPGTGVLVNLPTGRDRADLFTTWEHGDLDLELEVMLPRGSESGLFLQGRYEVQLADSWGVRRPGFADMGGIGQRAGEGGHPPRFNASRAPGLWQKLEIVFRAPRFDAQGRKIANARFVRVVLNGSVIHENIEVTGPTRGAAFQDERPTGPLMIQGSGPIALRNVRYKRYSGERVRVADLRYRLYEGELKELADLARLKPVQEGPADAISTRLTTKSDGFGFEFDGTLEIPTPGKYVFELRFGWVNDDPQFKGTVVGGGRLTIGGREVLLHEGRLPSAVGGVDLQPGRHRFTLTFFKNRPWFNRSDIELFVEGPELERQPLHELLATAGSGPALLAVEPAGEPVVLRSFVWHGEAKRTHAASVGDPTGVHYSYDLAQGALLHVWRGPFVETGAMWHGRGEDQTAQPRGSVLSLDGAPALAFLPDPGSAWPDTLDESAGFVPEGYALDDDGRPAFLYRLGPVSVEDRIRPAADGASLRRELRLHAPDETRDLYVRVAVGQRIRRLRDGSYVVDDFAYYVAPERGTPVPRIRRVGDREELLLPVRFRRGTAVVAYGIIW